MNTELQRTAEELAELDSVDTALSGAAPTALQPLYYLRNFQLALATLEERYVGLLSPVEACFITQFRQLPEPAQCLLTRLAMRKGPLFRRASLVYSEVPELDVGLGLLAALGWIDVDPVLSAEELFGVLNAQELRLTLCTARHNRPMQQKVHETQLSLPLPLQPAIRRSLADWNSRLAGSVVHFSIGPLINRLQLLFFGNGRQSWPEFVLVDLGVKRYEQVSLDAGARPFGSREEIEHFYRLHECLARLDAGVEASVVSESASVPVAVGSWLRGSFAQLHLRLGDRLGDEGHIELALRTYRECGAVEGLLRATRLQMRLGQLDAALRDALAAADRPSSEAQREAIERVITRLRGRIAGGRRQRKARVQPEGMELILSKSDAPVRIEWAVAQHLARPDAPVFYVENALITSLFGLLCWDAIFAPVQGAFFHPFQAAPADLFTAEFRERRNQRFQYLLGLLDSGQHEPVIRRIYRAKAGTRTHFVHWRRVRPPLVSLALQCIAPAHLRLCFHRLLDDLKENSTGMPDLIQFWPAQQRYRLIEVKGPGDSLKDNQRRWLNFFAQNDMPAIVCRVRFTSRPAHSGRLTDVPGFGDRGQLIQ